MATKIRLQRHGRKGYAFYHIVVADSRAPRDGKFIERLGLYNPNTNPATIDLDFERALYWVETGAQPTDTARNILSREGVLMKKHLNGGVKKGAFSAEECESKFNAWKQTKESAINAAVLSVKDAARAEAQKRLDAEIAYNKAKEEVIAKKLAEEKAKEEAEAKAKADAEAAAAAAIKADAPEAQAQEAAPAAE